MRFPRVERARACLATARLRPTLSPWAFGPKRGPWARASWLRKLVSPRLPKDSCAIIRVTSIATMVPSALHLPATATRGGTPMPRRGTVLAARRWSMVAVCRRWPPIPRRRSMMPGRRPMVPRRRPIPIPVRWSMPCRRMRRSESERMRMSKSEGPFAAPYLHSAHAWPRIR